MVFGGGGFFAGMQFQKSQLPKQEQVTGQRGSGQGRRFGGGLNGGGRLAGEILSADDKSVTVKLPDGSSKIVFLSDKTQINKAETAQKSDLKVGQMVAVFGSDNSDGSVTASNIQLNPMFGRMGGTPSASPK